jgi:T5SS/PEP-CTERM-associated repeat protein
LGVDAGDAGALVLQAGSISGVTLGAGISPGSSGTVTVSGNAAQLNLSATLRIAVLGGTGTVNVASGGRVTAGGLLMSQAGESFLNVSGGHVTFTGTSDIGRGARAEVAVTAGGTFEANVIRVGQFLGATGIVTLDDAGSTLVASCPLTQAGR